MELIVGMLAGLGRFAFRLTVIAAGFVVFVYLAVNLVKVLRGPLRPGVLRHDAAVGVLSVFAFTFLAVVFAWSWMGVPGWEARGPRAVVFYLLVAMISASALYLANLSLWKIDFSGDEIVEHRTLLRRRTVRWRDVVSWSLDDRSACLMLKLRNGRAFDIFFSDVEGAPALFEALEARGLPREDLATP